MRRTSGSDAAGRRLPAPKHHELRGFMKATTQP